MASNPGLDAVFKLAPVVTAVLEPDFTIVVVSDAFVRATRCRREDVVGKKFFDVFPDPSHNSKETGSALPLLRASLNRVLATGAPDRLSTYHYGLVPFLGPGSDFAERSWEILNYPILNGDGQLTHLIHQANDTTELVRLRQSCLEREAELDESLRVYAAVYDQGLFAGRLNLAGEVTHANRASLELCGFTSADVLGKPFWECGWWNRSAEVQAWVKAGVEQALCGVPFHGSSPYFLADGTERTVEFSCMPITDHAGNVVFVVPTGLDVTERFQAEQERQASAILESITDAFVAIDRDWRFTYLNHHAQRLLGRKPDELVGRVLWDEYPGLRGSEYEAEFRRVATEGVASTQTVFYPGHDRWYEVNASSTASGLSIYFRDVSRRVWAETEREHVAAEAERERRIYHAALSNSPDLIYVVGLDHRFIYANEALLATWGRTWSEAVGKNCLELGYEPWHAALHDREIEQVISSRMPIRGEVPFTGTKGRRIYDYIFVPVFGADGTVQAIAGTTRDLTDQKAHEEALRLSEQRFRMTADHAPVLIWISDAAKRWTWFNQPWLDFTGRAMDQEMGNGWLENLHPDDHDRCVNTIVSSFDARERFTVEFRVRRHDGVYRWMLGNGTPLFGAGGQFDGYIGTCVDINDRIEAENKLRDADRRKDEFLAMLAHELRNPLAAIGNAVTVLKMSREDEEGVQFAKDVIERQAKQLAHLIDDLLDVSRITSGKIRLRPEWVDAAAILRLAIESVTPLIKERKHTLVTDFEDGCLPLRADPIRIEQIVTNLLTNAAKYSGTGGRLWLTAKREEAFIVITVRDNGIGIAPEKVPEMFQLFSQGERSIARSEGGLGVGLTIVKQLVELHGGEVSATSDGIGQGSTFTVRLPAARRAGLPRQTTSVTAPVAAQAKPRGRRILVVDDNEDTANSLARLLKRLGNEVRLAHDGHTALEVDRLFRPEFILLDIGLPGMDGYEVARRIKEQPNCQKAVIIAVSGYGQDDDRRRSRDAGFDHHFVKPVDFDSLVALLAQCS